ncbi:MAG: urea amidolyase associated protein UAAP1 [Pseudomonadota bacterium]|nr:urea amidolyase associated protein UAAP1 [Pseudomonadota bacterium]
MTEPLYQYTLPPAAHWSLRVRRGTSLRLTDVEGGANLGMMFYNPEDLLEKYNAPDTLKCQHTFKLTRGNCLYSDMGRIFCSITADSFGWHDTVCGNTNKEMTAKKWGEKDYQAARNEWHQNGYDSFLVELAKYGLNGKDLASNLNLFSKVMVDDSGNLSLDTSAAQTGAQITLRFEMDTLVILHSCPHPLNPASEYPYKPVHCELLPSAAVADDDYCLNFRPENRRGFENNRLYHFFR